MAMTKYKKGRVVKGTVTGIEPYGAFVSFDEFYSGLIHISEISHGFVKDIHDFLNIGDVIYTEILEVDDASYQLKLSIKNIAYKNSRKYSGKHRQIIETKTGFQTLERKLPYWIAENLKKSEKSNKLY